MALQKAEKLPKIEIIYLSLNYARTIPLGISTLKPLKPIKSFSSAMSPKNERHFIQ